MELMTIHPILFWLFIGMELFLFLLAGWFMFLYFRRWFYDVFIFFDKAGRWRMIYDKIYGDSTYNYKKQKYFIKSDINKLNRRGKSLNIYTEGKPNPLEIGENNTSWVSSESMMSIINNKLIQKLVQPANAMTDILMVLGSIAGLLSLVGIAIILAKSFGML